VRRVNSAVLEDLRDLCHNREDGFLAVVVRLELGLEQLEQREELVGQL
jgi:hypothetical protein